MAKRETARFAPTVAALAADYIERDAKPRKRSWEADERTLRVDVLPVLGRMQASEVQRKHIRALLDDIVARGTAARPNRTHGNRVRALLHALFAFGIRRELLTANPVDGVERQPERPRDKVLTADEVRTIFKALEGERTAMQSYVRLLFLTGSRGGELLKLRWEQVTLSPEAGSGLTCARASACPPRCLALPTIICRVALPICRRPVSEPTRETKFDIALAPIHRS